MATKQLKLSELKVSDLKRELEERDLETTGVKAILQARLKKALEDDGENLEDYREDLKNLRNEYDKKIEVLQENLARVTLSSTSSSDAAKGKPTEEQKVIKLENSVKLHIKTPEFDGKSSWPNYLKQFEAAAKANNWTSTEKATALTVSLRGEAIDILQTLKEDEQEDYEQLVKQLKMRYGNAHLEQVYQTQLRNRYQSSKENLQKFEADIARLVRLAYPTTPDNVLECLAVQAFVYGVRDDEIQQALRLARPKTLIDALSYALDHEAAKLASNKQSRVRNIDANINESNGGLEETMRRIASEVFSGRKKLQCWNCGELGHPRRFCRKPLKKTTPKTEEEESGN